MKEVRHNTELISNFQNMKVMYLEQVDYSFETTYYYWDAENWKTEKKNDKNRSCYFIVRPKTN